MKVFIPFRMRDGGDPQRGANLDVVQAWWYAHGYDPVIVSDGLSGDAQFNRHRAYNRAVEENPSTLVYVFTEADMIIHPSQIEAAAKAAAAKTGLVVPFTQYRYLSERVSSVVRENYNDMDDRTLAEWWTLPVRDSNSIFDLRPESVMDNGRSIGAINVVSKETLRVTGGFTEKTSGNWYDDNIIEEGFAFLTRKTRFITGPAVHLYHQPGHTGDHLTAEDRQATAYNKQVLEDLRKMIRRGDKTGVRHLLAYRAEQNR